MDIKTIDMRKIIVIYNALEILSVGEYGGGEVLTAQNYLVDTKDNASIALGALGYEVSKIDGFVFSEIIDNN